MALFRAGLKVKGVQQRPFLTVGKAMEFILRSTLAQNFGMSVIRMVTQLCAKHAQFCEEAEKTGE